MKNIQNRTESGLHARPMAEVCRNCGIAIKKYFFENFLSQFFSVCLLVTGTVSVCAQDTPAN
ncbi:MAG TPA: hypothetical protein VN824_09320, partial [Puia sp.]|nr:hypothetical protein [Puia sp.]